MDEGTKPIAESSTRVTSNHSTYLLAIVNMAFHCRAYRYFQSSAQAQQHRSCPHQVVQDLLQHDLGAPDTATVI